MSKAPPSDRFRKEIRTFFEQMGETEDGAMALSELVRRASHLIVQAALEAEQADFIGREHCARGSGNGYRSGYESGFLDTAEGRLAVHRPQVRDADRPFRSALYEWLRGDSEMVERRP